MRRFGIMLWITFRIHTRNKMLFDYISMVHAMPVPPDAIFAIEVDGKQ